MFYIFLNKK